MGKEQKQSYKSTSRPNTMAKHSPPPVVKRDTKQYNLEWQIQFATKIAKTVLIVT